MKFTRDHIFLLVIGLLFAGFAVLFLCFPRSTVSELERRELTEFPEFSMERLADGSFAAGISSWFSDTEPFRDRFMEANHSFRRRLALRLDGDQAVTFHRAPGASASGAAAAPGSGAGNADAEARLASNGIIVTGAPGSARALMIFGGSAVGKKPFADALNEYHRQLGPGVRVYSMVIPGAIEFYCPATVEKTDQAAWLRNLNSQFDPAVRVVDVYSALKAHVAEPIYLRTDHHWAPLGAYYAASSLAKAASVPFRSLKEYDRGVTHNFVGTMYGYSNDITVKQSPEDFVYYTPKNRNYKTWYTDYVVDRDFKLTGERGPHEGKFFIPHKDGSSAAYSTMLGSDMRLAKVITGAPGNRRVLIVKDSFGNAVPGFLFGSFAEVHVVDFRYFPHSLKKYITDHHITDVVICVNIFNANSGGVAAKLKKLLSGAGFDRAKEKTEEKPREEEKKAEQPQESEESGAETAPSESPE